MSEHVYVRAEMKLLTKKRGSSTQGVPAGKEHLAWVTNTVTLIQGERDAVLVDTFLSAQHSKELVDWVVESGKKLRTIYITHGHGDHFFDFKILLDRFTATKPIALPRRGEHPGPDQARIRAVLLGAPLSRTASVAAGRAGGSRRRRVSARRPSARSDRPGPYRHVALDGVVGAFHRLGHLGRLRLQQHAPLPRRCDAKARNEWLLALDRIESLHPRAVVAGHGVLDPDSSPRHIGETRRYLHDFGDCVATTSTALELYEKMLALYPDRVNPGSLWGAAKAAKP
jgi:glyoxylase-like metal-dependent hydrolase (beta-lactamase superfamily II)